MVYLKEILKELVDDNVLGFVYNPYPTAFCDDCGNEVDLESIENGYSAFHGCEKIDRSVDEVDEYSINEKALLGSISNYFGSKEPFFIDQAKIKLRQHLKEGYLYEFRYDEKSKVLTINGDRIILKEDSKLAKTSRIVSYYFNKGLQKVLIVDIEDDFNQSEFLNISNLSGDTSKLNQKIRLETGLKLEISIVGGYMIIK